MMDEKSCKSLYQFSRADNAHARRSRTSLSIMVSPGAKPFPRLAQAGWQRLSLLVFKDLAYVTRTSTTKMT